MANFEQLIRSAIHAKQASTAEARAQVYASSRNALQKIIAKNPSLTPEAANLQQQQLEAVIDRIENEFREQLQPPSVSQTVEGATAAGNIEPQTTEPAENNEVGPSDVPPAAEPVMPAPVAAELPTEPGLPLHAAEMTGPAEVEAPVVQPAASVQPQPAAIEETGAVDPAPAVAPMPDDPPPPEKDDPMAELEQILAGGRASTPVESHRPVGETHFSAGTASPATENVPQVTSTPDIHVNQPVHHTVEPQTVTVQQPDGSSGSTHETMPGDGDVMRAEPRHTELPPEFTRRRKSQKRFVWFLIVLLCLAVLALVAFRIFSDFFDSYIASSGSGSVVISDNASRKDSDSDYVDILEPGDLTALSVTDNGKVEIVNEQSNEMIRLMSVRDQADVATPASPILIRLKPGVIEQIRGKRVTAEIYARSGSGGASQFTVECKFENATGCGRKRFRVGTQPEASIFAFTMEDSFPIDRSALIAINTDITPAASVLGRGDVLDIVYVRLRTFKDE